MSLSLTTSSCWLSSQESKLRGDYETLLRYRSVSGDPAYVGELRACCEWLQRYVKELGLRAELWETGGNPALFAEYSDAGTGRPTLLIYHHYDVQPANPYEWQTPPFEPTRVGEKTYCRGAQDNKGQLFYVLCALRFLLEREGRLPINIKLLIDGEEERGSAGLTGILEEKRERLRADTVAVVDLGIEARNKPSLCLGIRGIVGFDVEAAGPPSDRHSGEYGGALLNPNQALVALLAKLHDPETGAVAVPHFYDDVLPPSEADLAAVNQGSPEEDLGKSCGGEHAFSPLARIGLRPTLEINGIQGGTIGAASRTVIPAAARAHLTCRLVPNQDPDKIGELVKEAIQRAAPSGVTVTVEQRKGVGKAARSDPHSKAVQAVSRAYSELFGLPCTYRFSGGTIGIASALSHVSGGTLLLMGLGLPEDNMHGANESFDWGRMEQGVALMSKIIENLATEKRLQDE